MDVVRVCFWLFENASIANSAIYNLGTGEARTFNDLVKATFTSMSLEPQIRYIEIPEDIRETYQYHTEAAMSKLRLAGYTAAFYTLEEGIADYVNNYLIPSRYF